MLDEKYYDAILDGTDPETVSRFAQELGDDLIKDRTSIDAITGDMWKYEKYNELGLSHIADTRIQAAKDILE